VTRQGAGHPTSSGISSCGSVLPYPLLGRAVPAVVTALLRLMRHRAAAIAAYKCIAVMDLQTLARRTPAP
jgi:hypothetical protein